MYHTEWFTSILDRSFQAETDAKLYQRITDFEAQLSMVKSQIPQDLQPRLSRVEKLLRTGKYLINKMLNVFIFIARKT